MKKLLSIILCALMVASMFSMVAVPTVMAEEAADTGIVIQDFSNASSIPNQKGASYDNGALKFDMTANGGVGTFSIPVDPTLFDANTLYTINVGFKTEGINALCFFMSNSSAAINNTTVRYNSKSFRGEFIIVGASDKSSDKTTNLPTEWTEVVANEDLMPAGNSMTLNFTVAADAAVGAAWVDYIKLVPVESSKIAGGSVKIIGVDANKNTIYSATADEGFKVADITAKLTNNTSTVNNAQTITEISRTDKTVKFIVSGTPSYANDRICDRYLTVNFVEAPYVDKDGAIVLKGFNAPSTILSAAGASYDNGAMKLDMTANKGAATFTLPVDKALIDANTLYTINVGLKTQNMSDICFYVTGTSNTLINGVGTRYVSQPYRGDFMLLASGDKPGTYTTNLPTEWKDIVSNNDLMFVGSSTNLNFALYTNTAAGTAWIDYIKLVPVTKAVGGSVKVTGVDENNKTVYTATADDGFKIGSVSAKISNNTGTATTALTIKEISRTDSVVKFIIDYVPSYGPDRVFDRFLTVNFEANETYVASNGNIVLKEFTALTADVTGKGHSIDTEKAYSGTSSLKFALGESTCSGWYNVACGATINIYPDMELLDVNKKYRVKVALATDNTDETVTFTSFVRFFGTVNGVSRYATAKVNGDNKFMFLSGAGLTSDWTQYTSSAFAAPFGNDFHFEVSVYASAATTANVWIDKLELIPIEDGIDDGVVRVTGTTEDGATIYTAYANEGYTVDAINASAGQVNNATIHPLNVNIVEKVSDREVSFTVDSFNFDGGQRIMDYDVGRYYIQAIFGSENPIIMDADDEYIISDLSENTYSTTGNATAIYEEGTDTGVCYATDKTETIYFQMDANTMAKFDAANYYKLTALMQSSEDWEGNVYFKVRYGGGAGSYALTENGYGEYYILGAKNDYRTPDSIFGWSKFTSSSVFPILGNYVQIEMFITRTSETGTLYIDNIGLCANDSDDATISVDYSVRNGFVKSRYDLATNSIIYTPVAFEGYEYDNMTVKFRNWNGVVIDGVEMPTMYEAPKTLKELKSVTERSYAVDISSLRPNGTGGRVQSIYAAERYITASFKEAVVGTIGDANDDGTTNILDFIKVHKHLADNSTDLRILNVDYNDTKTVDIKDLIALKKQLLGITV